MKAIRILGTGCPKCKKLAENAEAGAPLALASVRLAFFRTTETE